MLSSPQAPPPRGYLLMAVGKPHYLEMAVDCALAIREHCALPIALMTDAALLSIAQQKYARLFYSMATLPERFNVHRARKYAAPWVSPFEHTMFIDADCLLLRNIDELWQAAEGKGFRFVGEMLDQNADKNHHGFSTRRLMQHFELTQYLKCNSGAFYFERDAGRKVADACLKCYCEEILPSLRGGFLGDEIAFAVVGGRENLSTFDTAPMLWGDELASFDPNTRPAKAFLHFIAPLSAAGLHWALGRIEARRVQWHFASGSSQYWRQKNRHARRSEQLSKLLLPLVPLARLLRWRALSN